MPTRTTNAVAVAEAIRIVTAACQSAIDAGERSARIDAHDLIDLLLAVADELDPEFGPTDSGGRCPGCGERDCDHLAWDDAGETVACSTCGMVFVP